jgi:RHS repeat-associated protein
VAYYFSDHLKTASVITDATGNIKAESDYYPWGGELASVNADSNHFKFTGKERDAESGLDLMGARYYSSTSGRFTKADPLMIQKQKFLDPQQWNMFQYARNSPLRFIDPTGKAVQLSDDEKERARQLSAARNAVGDNDGNYLYTAEKPEKDGHYYLKIYSGGKSGKGPDFSKLNGAAEQLSAIIKDTKVATVQLVKPGLFSSGNGSTEIQRASDYVTPIGATVKLNSGTLKPLPGNLLSSGKDETPTLGDVFSHEMGNVYSHWFAGGTDVDGYAVRMENETRELNGESIRLGHERPGDVNLEHPNPRLEP